MRGLLVRAVGYALLIAAAYLIIGPTFFSLQGLFRPVDDIFIGIFLLVVGAMVLISLDSAADDTKKRRNQSWTGRRGLMSRKTIQTGTILDEIVVGVGEELEQAKRERSISDLKDLADEWEAKRLGYLLVGVTEGPMKPYFGGKRIQLIAEVKKASPSKPNLALDLDHVKQGLLYQEGGAAGISVVTEKRKFRGHLEFMADVRRSFKVRRPAILRKDFLFDPYQLWEALAYGADAVLLITAILEPDQLRDLIQQANELGLDTLVEVHNEEEVQKALAVNPDLIGINNRNLRDFTVDLATTERLRKEIPEKFPVVGESGIHTRDDALRLADCGVDALLIGEALVTADDPKAKMREFLV